MSGEVVVNNDAGVVTAQEAHQAEVQAVEAEALQKFQEAQQKALEQSGGEIDGVPEGYNPDGTPIVEEGGQEPILGKFKSQEDLVKAYQELEKKLGGEQPTEETPAVNTEEPTVVETPEGSLDITKYMEEYSNDKSLSEDSYKELEKMGLNKSLVDDYIQAKEAQSQIFTNSIYDMVGGQDSYTELITWAGDNLNEAQITEFNKVTQSNNPEAIKFAVENLKLRYDATGGKQPTRIEGSAKSEGTGMKAFTNKGEWQQATANPLYGRDAKYTSMIDKRYLQSIRTGTI